MSLATSSSRNSENGIDADEEIDIVDHWRGHTIEDGLSDGEELIRQKLWLLKDRKERDLELKKPPKKSRKKVSTRKLRQNNVTFRRYGLCTSQSNDQRKCPLRILQLAVPTKRHCMETWKSNNHVLPIHMMERLKQQVQNERPMFEITEALKCFKQKKRPINSRKQFSRLREEIKLKDTLNRKDMTVLSAIFGYRIIQKLLPCLKINLNPELQKICSVVHSDIEDLMKNKRFRMNVKRFQYLSDTSEKITLWISDILEDAYFKQLEEDFRDLEKEEGAVWDILDDLLRIVMELCIPSSPDEYFNTSSSQESLNEGVTEEESDTENTINTEDHIKNEIHKIIDGIPEDDAEFQVTEDESSEAIRDAQKKESEKFSSQNEVKEGGTEEESDTENTINTEDHIKNEIHKIIDGIPEDNAELQEAEDESSDAIRDAQKKESEKFSSQNEVQDLFISDEAETTNDPDLDQDTFYDIEKTLSDTNINISRLVDSNYDQSEVMDDAVLEEETDKKVKFSPVSLDNSGRSGLLNEKSTNDKHKNTNIEMKTPSNIVLGTPNKNLLTDMDEVWPFDLDPDAIKLTTSVSKSITSMGNITEWDESPINFKQQEDKSFSQLLTILQESDIDDDEEEIKKHNYDSKNAALSNQGVLADETNKKISKNKSKDSNQMDNLSEKITENKLQRQEELNNLESEKQLEDNIIGTIGTNSKAGVETDDSIEIKKNTKENVDSSGTVFENKQEITPAISWSSGLLKSEIVLSQTQATVIPTTISSKVYDSNKQMLTSEDTLDKKNKTLTDASTKSATSSKPLKVKPQTNRTIRQNPNTAIAKDHLDKIKFDYRVNVTKLPSWLNLENVKASSSGPSNREALQKRPEYFRKWCKNLDKELEVMQNWNYWMKDVCMTIISFKCNCKQDAKSWVNLKHNVDKSIINWDRKYQHSLKILNSFKNKSQDIHSQLSSSIQCKCERI